MFCEGCGNELQENAKFCNMCGKEVEDVQIEVVDVKEEQVIEVKEEVQEDIVEEIMEEKVVAPKEAIKFISFVGIIIAAVGAFLPSVTYTYSGKDFSEKLFDYLISDLFLVGILLMFLMLIIRQSKLSVAGFTLAIASVYIYIREFLQYRKTFVTGINIGLGAYLILAGLFVYVIGLFIKFSKKNKLFR